MWCLQILMNLIMSEYWTTLQREWEAKPVSEEWARWWPWSYSLAHFETTMQDGSCAIVVHNKIAVLTYILLRHYQEDHGSPFYEVHSGIHGINPSHHASFPESSSINISLHGLFFTLHYVSFTLPLTNEWALTDNCYNICQHMTLRNQIQCSLCKTEGTEGHQ